jgi:hypothetical protein
LIIPAATFFCSVGLTFAMQLPRGVTALKERQDKMLFRMPSLIVLLAVALLTSCETTKKDQADSGSIIREPDKAGQTYGEVGAMYGTSAGH